LQYLEPTKLTHLLVHGTVEEVAYSLARDAAHVTYGKMSEDGNGIILYRSHPCSAADEAGWRVLNESHELESFRQGLLHARIPYTLGTNPIRARIERHGVRLVWYEAGIRRTGGHAQVMVEAALIETRERAENLEAAQAMIQDDAAGHMVILRHIMRIFDLTQPYSKPLDPL